MKLLVIVVCLLSERFLMHALSYQRFSWFADYSQRIMQLIEQKIHFTNPWLILASIIFPIVFITSFVYLLLHGILFGFVGLILSVLIFFYCLGPQNVFYPLSETSTDAPNDQLVGRYLSVVNSQLFAVLFWYIIAGPIAALTYRLITLSRGIAPISQQADEVADVLEWIPARLTALLFLLVGNFQRGFKVFTQFLLAKPDLNTDMLSQCGLQAVRSNDTDEVPMPLAETLVEHAAIVSLVLIALFTLVAWL